MADETEQKSKRKNKRYLTERDLNIKQRHFRIHRTDDAVLSKRIAEDDVSWQKLITFFVESYLNKDPRAMSYVQDIKGHRERRAAASFSPRERREMIERLSKDDK